MAREYKLNKVRNFGIMAHIDTGKTTVSERILYYTGRSHKNRRSARWCRHDGLDGTRTRTRYHHHLRGHHLRLERPYAFLIDTPGHVDFTMEVERALRVLDGAIALYCAVGGVQPQSETVWRQSERYEVPKIAFVNKMDRIGADFYAVIENIQEMLGANPVPVTIPIGASEDFIGIIDLISMKALIFKDEVMGAEWDETEIPAELADTAAEWRNNLVEKCAEQDEALHGKIFRRG